METKIYRLATLDRLIEALKGGGIIACPAEGVFGLGCDPDCTPALRRLRRLKSRPASDGLIVVGDCPARFSRWLSAHWLAHPRLQSACPEPTTWLAPVDAPAPVELTGTDASKLAVRIVEHEPIRLLCHSFGGAVVSTSANPAGLPPAVSAAQVLEYFSGKIDAVLDEPVGPAKGCSRIQDLLTLQEYRAYGRSESGRRARPGPGQSPGS